ncbi:hypothetical protein [Moorena sp. SIO3F7]|uniref:hypothetical protein n=1 Tax=Moorena sp. SIO3F7 TaxID=2607839 RepID=UPI0014010322|nr:hypothetical protein [Moorena sp. SIO3F7]NEP99988.1 hypothetical protein [Moorena sp. SIO3F7]
MGRWGDGEMGSVGRWGDGEMGRWGDGEMGRWGDGEFLGNFCLLPIAYCLSLREYVQNNP